jgi:WD40 repeat protein
LGDYPLKKLCLILLLLLAVPAAAQESFDVPMYPFGYNMDISPNGRVAAVYENNVLLNDLPDLTTLPIRLIDLETGSEVGALAGHSDFAVDFAFTPDGTTAASLHANGDVHLWFLAAQGNLRQFKLLLLGGGRIQFLDDNRTLVILVGGVNSRLYFLDIETGAITHIVGHHFLRYEDFRENYTTPPDSFDLMYVGFAVSPDGSTVAVATANDQVILFDVETGRETTIREPAEELGRLRIRRMEFIENGTQLIYVVQDEPSTVHVWDIAAGEEVLTAEMGAIAWDYQDGLLAWADSADNTLRVADLQTGDVLLEQPLESRVSPLSTVAFTSDAVIVGGLRSDRDEGNVLLKIELETGD